MLRRASGVFILALQLSVAPQNCACLHRFKTAFTRERSSDPGIPGRNSAVLLQKVLHVIYYRISNQALNPRLWFATHPAAQLHQVSVTKASKMCKENNQLIRKLGNCHVLLPKRMPIKLHLCIIL